jgi:hypothetical protein
MRPFVVALPLLALGALQFLAPACVIPDISTGADAGSSSASSSSSSGAGGGSSSATTTGASCTQVSSSISLCLYISSCPNLILDPKVFPSCGFRIHGDAIDPECLCGNTICPIGAPTSCSEAAADTSGDVTYDSVCEQSVEGHCTALGTGGSSTSSACETCVQNCDNVPSCVEACGC